MLWTDGRVVAEEALRVSVLDRVFEHGLGLFETLRTWKGRAPLLARHLGRLRRSAAELGLPLDGVALPGPEAVGALLRAEGIEGDARLRITLTGGTGAGSGGALFVSAAPLATAEVVPAVVDVGLWKVAPGDPLARHKALNYWSRRLAYEAARRAGCDETLSVAPDGTIWEGSRTNVFAVRGERLLTPALEGPIVPGVMRAFVLELAAALSLAVETVTDLTLEGLVRCDEVFLTNSVRGVVPVARVAGHAFEAPGPWTRRLGGVAAERLEGAGEA